MTVLVSFVCWASALCVLVVMTSLMRFLAPFSSLAGYTPVVKAMCRLMLRCFPLRVEVEGMHRLDPRRSYIFITNHVNILDVFLLEACIPWSFAAMERPRHFTWPFYRTFITIMKHIPLSLDRGPGTAVSLRRADRALRSGRSIAVAPEGDWTEDGKLAPFARGAFHMARRNNVDLAPVVMAGLFHAIPANQWLVRAGTVRFVFGEPIRPSDYPDLDDWSLAELARERMIAMLEAAGDRGRRRLKAEPQGNTGQSDAA